MAPMEATPLSEIIFVLTGVNITIHNNTSGKRVDLSSRRSFRPSRGTRFTSLATDPLEPKSSFSTTATVRVGF